MACGVTPAAHALFQPSGVLYKYCFDSLPTNAPAPLSLTVEMRTNHADVHYSERPSTVRCSRECLGVDFRLFLEFICCSGLNELILCTVPSHFWKRGSPNNFQSCVRFSESLLEVPHRRAKKITSHFTDMSMTPSVLVCSTLAIIFAFSRESSTPS